VTRRKLETQFKLVLATIFACGMLLSSLLFWQLAQRGAEESITTQAQMLMTTMNSVRDYTSSNIEPLLKNRLPTESRFVSEIVPAFAAREIFEIFRNRPEYRSLSYKEATLNPTNIRDIADRFEIDLVKKFRTQADLSQLSGYRSTVYANLFYIARPMRVRASCLQCHGKPQDAPKSQIAAFGNRNGFGWKLNEIVAAQTIYVPADTVFERSRQVTLTAMLLFTGIFVTAGIAIARLLKQRVVNPLSRLTQLVEGMSAGNIQLDRLIEFDGSEVTRFTRRTDEPGELARAFQEMAHEITAREHHLNNTVRVRTAQLAASKEEAEAANRAKSQFLSHMSHELRTPLNAILGFTQLMVRQSDFPQREREYLQTIDRSGEHLLELINSVLEMSKIEAGKMTLDARDFDLYALLISLQQMFDLQIENPQFIHTDERKLRQVLINLVGNAIKFTDRGRVRLQVGSTRAGLGTLNLQFAIVDTGVGIAEAELARLFEPFVRASNSKAAEGTGLGLAIARQFVRLLGGEIVASSQLGMGTRFSFNIEVPAVDRQLVPLMGAQRPQVVGLAEGQPPYRIAIVEDKLENRQLLLELLTPIGFEIQIATNGREAVDLALTWHPQLIWMDIHMPEMDGYEALNRIAAANLTPKPLVIALTSSVLDLERTKAIECGFDDFVRKPFRVETIFDTMAEHLGVRYRYAATIADVPAAHSPLSPADLAFMPAEWCAKVHQAAMRVNAKPIYQAIAEIPTERVRTRSALTELVDNFRFEEIIALTDSLPPSTETKI
jgi:signal transduction histidine kinase/DNA-binding response OmpR family regulator